MTLLFRWIITFFNKSENFSIPGAVSCESVLLKGTVQRDLRGVKSGISR
jgi:hypothetical protein